MLRSCCVLQPPFLPWSGWFDLVDQADILIIMDDAQFSKQSWQQRNRIRTEKGLEYLSVPVISAGRMGQAINEVQLSDTSFVDSFQGRIRAAYQSAPFFSSVEPDLVSALRDGVASELLIDVNMRVISWLLDALGLHVELIRASELGVSGRRGLRVAALCQAVDARRYLSPSGARAYLEEDQSHFADRSIAVELQNYVHPEYEHFRQPFMAYASVLDLIMMQGSQAMSTIRTGRRPNSNLSPSIGIKS
jgi:hypothetical protein